MNKKVMSSMWGPSGPVLWDQPARQTTLALSPLCANLCPDQFVQQASAAARVVRPVDCGRLHRSPTGRPEWGQPPDAPSADHVLVRPAPALLTCWLGVSLPAVRRHDSVSPQRRLCRDGCGPLGRGRGRPRHGGRPRPPTAVLHNAGSPQISPPQRHGGRQPPPAPPVTPPVADDPHSTLSRPYSPPRAQLVSPTAQTPGCATPPGSVSPSHGGPHRRRPGPVRGSGA